MFSLKRFLVLFFFIGLILVFFIYRKSEKLEEHAPSFFDPISIEMFSSCRTPCIAVRVEDFNILSELDLGFRGFLNVSPNFIDKVKNKIFLYTKPMYGVRGKEYYRNIYEIPEIKIGNSSFSRIFIHDGYTEEFNNDAMVTGNDKVSSRSGDSRVGWELFAQSNLLLDFKNSKIAFCDSVATLKENGYPTESFIKTPLFLERGLVELDTMTSSGKLRCALDTGATFNAINREVSIESFDLDEIEEFDLFKIGGRDFGPIAFHPIAIRLPIHVEAMLGMEFLSEHVVFLDFRNSCAYIYRS